MPPQEKQAKVTSAATRITQAYESATWYALRWLLAASRGAYNIFAGRSHGHEGDIINKMLGQAQLPHRAPEARTRYFQRSILETSFWRFCEQGAERFWRVKRGSKNQVLGSITERKMKESESSSGPPTEGEEIDFRSDYGEETKMILGPITERKKIRFWAPLRRETNCVQAQLRRGKKWILVQATERTKTRFRVGGVHRGVQIVFPSVCISHTRPLKHHGKSRLHGKYHKTRHCNDLFGMGIGYDFFQIFVTQLRKNSK